MGQSATNARKPTAAPLLICRRKTGLAKRWDGIQQTCPLLRSRWQARFNHDLTILDLAPRTLASLLKQKVPTLVCFSAGKSRSPTIAAGTIALLTGANVEDCLRQVVSHYPADIVPALWYDMAEAVFALGSATH
jgi:hypothetical protein